MKQELPFAVGLLAAGCLLWIAPWSKPSPGTQPSSDTVKTTVNGSEVRFASLQEDAESARPHQDDQKNTTQPLLPQAKPTNPLIAERARQSNETQTPISLADTDPSFNTTSLKVSDLAPATFLHAISDPRAVELLVRISKATANSPPIGAGLKLKGHLFGQSIAADGKYFQMGQGTHKSRLELAFGQSPESPTVFQLCDGRFVYRLQTIGTEQTFEFVDLNRVQKQAGEKPTAFSPTGWVATGGLSSLFQHLGGAFHFGAPKKTAQGEIILRGSWSQVALQQIIDVKPAVPKSDKLASRTGIDWASIPPQLPHAVEIVFRENDLTGHFPVRVSFLKFQTSKSDSIQLTPTLNIAFTAPQPIATMTDRTFVIEASDSESTDTTDHYIARIEAFETRRKMAEVNASLHQQKASRR